MPKLTINDTEIDVPAGITVLQACELAGVEIPRFCYHDRLTIAGNCRMCLVEMEKAPKPVASCAMPVGDGMVIRTNTPLVQKAREGVMEFLLINHPLDCPICDQGGECDLQDQAMAYGSGYSRYDENKRAVPEKYMGPLIKTTMTRCIHCTRCVRFAEEIAGTPQIGAIGRGESMEITTLEHAVASELSANVIDLCPVGALTSKPYAFNARPWELRKTESVDVLDAVGSNIRVDVRGAEVLRILPRIHEDINEEWIADKTRYACDGLRRQRLDRPYIRKKGKLIEATWPEALATAAAALTKASPFELGLIAGDQTDIETLFLAKALWQQLGSPHLDCRQDGMVLPANDRAGFLFNTTIAGIEQADAALFIGTNPRVEAPLVNARLRKRWLQNKLPVASIGMPLDCTYPVEHLSTTPDVLEKIISNRHAFAKVLAAAEKPMLILGTAALNRPDSEAIIASAQKIADKYGLIQEGWNGYNVLHTAASRVGGLELGFVPGKGGKTVAEMLAAAERGLLKVVMLLGADEIDTRKLKDSFVIYQGHHGDRGAEVADVIFPAAAYTEKAAGYVNLEGRLQYTRQALLPPAEAKEDWKIIRALSAACGKPLPYDTWQAITEALAKSKPHLQEDTIKPAEWTGKTKSDSKLDATPFAYPINNYYQTCAISRASPTMAACTTEILESNTPRPLKQAS